MAKRKKKADRSAGRPSKFTPDLGERICSLVRMGNFMETAADIVGVSPLTIRRWSDKGMRGESDELTHFALSLKSARGISISKDVATISKAAANGDWRAAAWRLARKDKRWSEQVRISVEQELAGLFDRLRRHLPEEVYDRVLEIAAMDEDGEGATPSSSGSAELH